MRFFKDEVRKSKNLWSGLGFIFIGLVSTIWFLIRVIPKPSRATYPCMRAAAPLMSSFVLWLIGITASALFFKKSVDMFRKARVPMAIVLLVGAISTVAITTLSKSDSASASPIQATEDDYPANEPYGTAKGVFPGRVVWYWNPDATNEASKMTVNGDGIINSNDDVFFLPKNNNEAVIDEMMDVILFRLTGASSIANAWDSVFRYYNRTTRSLEIGYTAGEDIYIKTNNQGIGLSFTMNKDLSQEDNTIWGSFPPHMTATSPYSILATLKQLVNEAGIPQGNIYVGDPHNNFNNIYYDILSENFPDVHIIGVNSDAVTDCEAYGRTLSIKGSQDEMFYSDRGVFIDGGSDKFYTQLIDADYIINIAAMKSHIRGGITLFCKSHFGSHTRSSASHLHPGLVAPDDNTTNYGYGKYRVLTDIMGHENLGGKTIISILDGLWGGPPHELDEPRKWDMAPFNGDWTSSLFASIDPVAMASVAHDFLRTEYSITDWGNDAHPNILGVDDYLHQAADAQFWPDGISYDPENDGTPIGSLGTHEHWNSATNMQYTRNLDPVNGLGIQLLKAHEMGPVNVADIVSVRNLTIYPNPAQNYFKIQLENDFSGAVQVRIYKSNGQEILSKTLNKHSDYFESRVDIQELEAGMYIVSIESGKEITNKKLMISGE